MAFLIGILLFCLIPALSTAQNLLPPAADDLFTPGPDRQEGDSVIVSNDLDALGIELSPDAIEDVVKTKAKDSAHIDVRNNKFYLYREAVVEYQSYHIESGKIDFTQSSGMLNASPIKDSTGKITSNQTFKDNSETFQFEELAYNFNNKKAIVRNARMQYGEGFIASQQIKRNPDGSIFGYKNTYTTCNLDTPHFCIRAHRIKAIPGKLIATGPANIEIENIPTPLVLPFGIFPQQDKQTSGFILPSYTMEQRRGLGLQRGGYFLKVNEYFTNETNLDIFTKGSWGVVNNLMYNKRYQYSGSFRFGYNYTKTGESWDISAQQGTDFNIQWAHQMNPKARPGTNFSASVNVATRNYNMLNSVNMTQMLTNTFSSNISYTKSWIGKPFVLTAALRHDQNTNTRQMTFTLPEMNFAVSQFNPFQFRKNVMSPRWYEKITTNYNVALKNQVSFYDSAFNLRQISTRDFNNAIMHQFALGATYNVMKYFNLNFNLPYTEYWNTKQFLPYYNEISGTADTLLESGFYATRQFSANVNLSTRIYGMKMFRKGKIMGIRHVVMPTIGATYQPGFAHDPFNYFYFVRSTQDNPYEYYSPYANSTYTPFGGPSVPNPVGSVNLSINNTLAIKVRGTDSSDNQNVNIIDRFSISTNYNMFADSNHLAPISMAAGTRYKEYIVFSGGATFDPYKYVNNRRTKDYLLNLDEGIAKFHRGNISVGLNYRSQKKNQEEHDEKMGEDEEYRSLIQNGRYDNYYDFNVPFEFYANYSMNAARNYANSEKGIVKLNHSVTFGGQFNVTENWRFSFDSGYNFTQKQMSLTSINISRDLHCWQMVLNVIPFGDFRSFNFTLNVKSAVLQDLKLIRRKSFLDN